MNPITIVELTIHGIEMISEISKTLSDAHAGKLTPAEALAKIDSHHSTLLSDRARRDAEAAAKFGTSK